jgi:hypothetical protein
MDRFVHEPLLGLAGEETSAPRSTSDAPNKKAVLNRQFWRYFGLLWKLGAIFNCFLADYQRRSV